MRKPLRRHGDAVDLDIGALRNPLEITLSWADLSATLATSRNRAAIIGALTALVTALLASTVIGLFVAREVTSTVQADVGRASVRNCQRTNKVAPAIAGLKAFLESDASYARKLATLDDQQRVVDEQAAGLNRDLGRAVGRIPVVPRSIASDYARLANLDARQAAITAELGRLRRDAERLWAGHGKGRLSLAAQVSLLGQSHCDEILAP